MTDYEGNILLYFNLRRQTSKGPSQHLLNVSRETEKCSNRMYIMKACMFVNKFATIKTMQEFRAENLRHVTN